MVDREKAYVSSWPRVQGCRIHTRISRQTPQTDLPVVLVHGLGVSARYMLPTLTLLAQHYRVYSLEMPGSGNSDRPKHVLTVLELADILVEWLQTVGLTRAIFLGNSLGCQVIVDLAVRHPNCIDRAILVSPTIDTQDRTLFRQLWRGAQDLMREPWSLWPILASDYLTTGTRRILSTLRHTLEDHIEL